MIAGGQQKVGTVTNAIPTGRFFSELEERYQDLDGEAGASEPEAKLVRLVTIAEAADEIPGVVVAKDAQTAVDRLDRIAETLGPFAQATDLTPETAKMALLLSAVSFATRVDERDKRLFDHLVSAVASPDNNVTDIVLSRDSQSMGVSLQITRLVPLNLNEETNPDDLTQMIVEAVVGAQFDIALPQFAQGLWPHLSQKTRDRFQLTSDHRMTLAVDADDKLWLMIHRILPGERLWFAGKAQVSQGVLASYLKALGEGPVPVEENGDVCSEENYSACEEMEEVMMYFCPILPSEEPECDGPSPRSPQSI